MGGVMNLPFAFCQPKNILFIKRKNNMDKTTMILFILWMVLAVASFVCNFFIPVAFVRILGWVFGGFNMLIVISWITAYLKEKAAIRKYNKEMEKES